MGEEGFSIRWVRQFDVEAVQQPIRFELDIYRTHRRHGAWHRWLMKYLVILLRAHLSGLDG